MPRSPWEANLQDPRQQECPRNLNSFGKTLVVTTQSPCMRSRIQGLECTKIIYFRSRVSVIAWNSQKKTLRRNSSNSTKSRNWIAWWLPRALSTRTTDKIMTMTSTKPWKMSEWPQVVHSRTAKEKVKTVRAKPNSWTSSSTVKAESFPPTSAEDLSMLSFTSLQRISIKSHLPNRKRQTQKCSWQK